MAILPDMDMDVFFNSGDFADVADIGIHNQVNCKFFDQRELFQDGNGIPAEAMVKVLLVPYSKASTAGFGSLITNVVKNGGSVDPDSYLVQRVFHDEITGLLKLTLEKQ